MIAELVTIWTAFATQTFQISNDSNNLSLFVIQQLIGPHPSAVRSKTIQLKWQVTNPMSMKLVVSTNLFILIRNSFVSGSR